VRLLLAFALAFRATAQDRASLTSSITRAAQCVATAVARHPAFAVAPDRFGPKFRLGDQPLTDIRKRRAVNGNGLLALEFVELLAHADQSGKAGTTTLAFTLSRQ